LLDHPVHQYIWRTCTLQQYAHRWLDVQCYVCVYVFNETMFIAIQNVTSI